MADPVAAAVTNVPAAPFPLMPVIAGVSLLSSLYQGYKADKAQKAAQAEERKARMLEAYRQRVLAVREMQATTAALNNAAAVTGTVGSGVQGALSSTQSQFGFQTGLVAGQGAATNRAAELTNKAYRRQYKAQTAEAVLNFAKSDLGKATGEYLTDMFS